MRRLLITLAFMSCIIHSKLQSQEPPQEPKTTATGHYLFAWTGDAAHKGNDFLAVIDADPASKSYGQLMTTLATDQQTMRVHHTEYVMPASGMLFANDHEAGRTFILDLRDPLHPKTVTSFTDMAGYMHFSGVTYQVWRLSDLKLLKTAYLDVDKNLYGHVSPEEARLGPDGAVYVQTLGCGIERITDVDRVQPRSKLVYTFPGSFCGVPTIVGHYLIQSVPVMHGLVALDISDGNKPVEVSRLKLNDSYFSHWTGWDAKTGRLVVTGNQARLYLVKLDRSTGVLTMDDAFHDENGKSGFDFSNRTWPHGWTGTGQPHGVVFSR